MHKEYIIVSFNCNTNNIFSSLVSLINSQIIIAPAPESRTNGKIIYVLTNSLRRELNCNARCEMCENIWGFFKTINTNNSIGLFLITYSNDAWKSYVPVQNKW